MGLRWYERVAGMLKTAKNPEKGRPGLRRAAPNPTMKREGRHLLVPAPPHSGGCRQGIYNSITSSHHATQF